MYYANLRVDYKDDLNEQTEFVRSSSSRDILMIIERKSTNDKLHFHALFSTEINFSTLRQQWKKKFPGYDGKKNKDYSLTIQDPEKMRGYEQYLCKGPNSLTQPNVQLQAGKYTIEYVIELHTAYWEFGGPGSGDVKEDVPGTQMRAGTYHIEHSVVRVVKPKKNFINDVIEALRRQYPERKWDTRDSPIIFEKLMRMHGVHTRVYGPAQLENEMNVLLNILCYEGHYSDMYEIIRSRGNIRHL